MSMGIAMIGTIIITMPVLAEDKTLRVEFPDGYKSSYDGNLYLDGFAYSVNEVTEDGKDYAEVSVPEDETPKMAVMYKLNDNGVAKWMTVWKITTKEEENEEDGFEDDDIDSEGTSEEDGDEDGDEGTNEEDDDEGDDSNTGNDEDEAAVLIAEEITAFKDLLKYEGFAIRPNTDKVTDGLRVKSSIKKSAKDELTSADGCGDEHYKLVEYGHIMLPQTYHDDKEKYPHDFTYDGLKYNDYPKASECYKYDFSKGKKVKDNVSEEKDGRVVFTNCLYNLNNYKAEKYYRGYVIIKDKNDDEYILYDGPGVGRSVHYVAENLLKNNNAKSAKSFCNKVINTYTMDGMKILCIGESIMRGAIGKSGQASANTGESVVSDNRIPIYVKTKLTERYDKMEHKPVLLSDPNDLMPDDMAYMRLSDCGYTRGGSTYSFPGVNGKCFYDFAVKAKKNIGSDADDVDVVLIMGGTNDWWYTGQGNEGYGELNANGSAKSDGKNTYCSKVQETYEFILKEFPNAKLAVITPPQGIVINNPGVSSSYVSGKGHQNGATGKNLSGYIDTQIKIANYLSTKSENKDRVYVIDAYNNFITEGTSEFWSLFPDGIHPSNAGYAKLSEYIYKQLIDKFL